MPRAGADFLDLLAMSQTHAGGHLGNFRATARIFVAVAITYRRIVGRQSSRLAGSTHEDATFAGTQPALHLSEVH
jgi:hypothetical protein